MPGRPNVTIGPKERTLIVGRTQSGKTTLSACLTGGYRSLVVIDPKHRVTLNRTVTVVGDPALFAQTWPQRARRVIYRPSSERHDHADVDLVIRRVIRYGRTALVVDEAMELCTQASILPAYKRAITQGAELYVPVISLTQRPIGIHNVLLTEAEHFFIFDLPGEPDRGKMADFIGDGAGERVGAPYEFLYAGLASGGAVVRCPPIDLGSVPRPAADSATEAV
jgi:hypothetical protein